MKPVVESAVQGDAVEMQIINDMRKIRRDMLPALSQMVSVLAKNHPAEGVQDSNRTRLSLVPKGR